MKKIDYHIKQFEIIYDLMKISNQRKKRHIIFFIVSTFILYTVIENKSETIEIAGIELKIKVQYLLMISPLILTIVNNLIQIQNTAEIFFSNKIKNLHKLINSKLEIEQEHVDCFYFEIPDYFWLSGTFDFNEEPNLIVKLFNYILLLVEYIMFFIFPYLIIFYFLFKSFSNADSYIHKVYNFTLLIYIILSLIKLLASFKNLKA